MGYRIEVRDKNLNRVGEIDTWLQLDIVVQFCDQGSWKLLMKAGTEQAELLQQGGGVAIYQDGVDKPICTGQIESFQKYWTVEQHSSVGSVFVGGKTDNKLAYQRLSFPEPSISLSQQYSVSYDSRKVSGPAGALIWDELVKGLGSQALANRRVSGVTNPPRPSFGPAKADTLRYDVIGEKLATWCADKKTGWRYLYNPNTKTIDLDVYQPRDLSKSVRFSPDLGNLREYIWTLSAPSVTRAIVACQGDGKDRFLWQKIDSSSETEWGLQIEQFVDRRDIPLKTNTDGSPALVTKMGSDGFEDIGLNPSGQEWTTNLASARTEYANAGTALDAAKAAVAAELVNWQTARDNLTAAQQELASATTQAEKDAAQKKVNDAQAAMDQAQYNLDVKEDAQTDAETRKTNAANALKAAITAAKATAVDYYMDVVEQAADEILKEGEKSGNFQLYPIDTEQIKFGRDYFVGDIVTVSIDGVEYVDMVREVNITVDDGGKTSSVSPKIGEQGSGDPLNLYKTVFELREKLRKLEARM